MKLIHQTDFNEGYEICTHDDMNNILKVHYTKDNWVTRKVKILKSRRFNLWEEHEFKFGTIQYYFEEVLPDRNSHFSHPFDFYDVFSRTNRYWIWYSFTYPDDETEQSITMYLKQFPNTNKALLYSLSKDGKHFGKKSSIGNTKVIVDSKSYFQHQTLTNYIIDLTPLHYIYPYISFETFSNINNKSNENKLILKTPTKTIPINPLKPVIIATSYQRQYINKRINETRLFIETDALWTISWLFYRGGKSNQQLLMDRLNHIHRSETDSQTWISHKNLHSCLNPGIVFLDIQSNIDETRVSSFVKHIPLEILRINKDNAIFDIELKEIEPKYIILVVHRYNNENIQIHLVCDNTNNNKTEITLKCLKSTKLFESITANIFKLPPKIDSIVGIKWTKKGEFGTYYSPDDIEYIDITDDDTLNRYNLLLL